MDEISFEKYKKVLQFVDKIIVSNGNKELHNQYL
jgi:hypothetical protein